MRIWAFLSGAIFAGMAAVPACAVELIGSAVVVVNEVTAELDREKRNLATGANVHQNELIEVAADASSELKLNDETKMALGPGAKLLLDKFVYDPQATEGAIAVNLVKGAFRFVTGVAAKPNYVVRVPQASITVRGTVFDVFVEDSGRSWLLLHEGGVRICNERGKCRDLDEPGKLVRITDGGDVGAPTRWAKLPQKTADFSRTFPFVEKPPQIDPSPVFTRDALLLDIDFVKPKRNKPDRVKDPRNDRDAPVRVHKTKHRDRDDPPKRKANDKRKEAATHKKHRRVSRRDRDDQEAVNTGIGIAIGIAGGLKFGGGGRGGGHRHPGGNRSSR